QTSSFSNCVLVTGSAWTPTPTWTPAPPTPTRTPRPPTPTGTPTTPAPTPSLQILSLAPSSGAATGGTPVAVTGTGFLPGASLTLGGILADSIVVVGSSEIDATTPVTSPGTLDDVTVTNPDSSSTTTLKGWFANFLDVAQDDPFHAAVESVFRAGITAG